MTEKQMKLERFTSLMVRYRLLVLLVVLVVTAAFSFGATKISTEVILAHLFPHDHPYLKLHARFSEVFGSGGS